MNGLQAIKYSRGSLEVLDQLKLPHEFEYEHVTVCEQAFDCIRAMRVRGAPAIAIVAALSLAVELVTKDFEDASANVQIEYIHKRLDYLMDSRPTAVDLSNAIRLLKATVDLVGAEQNGEVVASAADVRNAYVIAAEKILEDDLATNLAIGRYGAEYLRRQERPVTSQINQVDGNNYFCTSPAGTQGEPHQNYRKLSVLTHCNTGSLATSGHGTALGIIRSLHKMNYLDHAYCTETRPYNQGSRLTAFELEYEKIPATLITDSMAGALFARFKAQRNIAAVIVGADRVARNGDTANKIGTYSLAVLAKFHGIKFIVAAPTTSIDLYTASGDSIKIEDRPKHELSQISGPTVVDGKVDLSKPARVAIAHQGIDVWNPSFDVTPHHLIDAIITEKGEVVKSSNGTFDFQPIMPGRWEQQTDTLHALSTTALKTETDDGAVFEMEHV